MRYLGLDIGDKRIGIALSDQTGLISMPFEVYHTIGSKKDQRYITRLALEKEVETVVIGLPKHMNGTEGERAAICREFARRLGNRLSIPIVMQDERLSTVSAERVLIKADVSRKKRRQVIDMLAAQVILQSYLDKVNMY